MMKINQNALKIMDILESRGYEAFAVGGCVRDLILGKVPKDWDITTNALPGFIGSLLTFESVGKVFRVPLG